MRSKSVETVSTYYGECAASKNSLVADGCIIEGELNNCIVFAGTHIEKGAKLSNCIIMQGSRIGEGVILSSMIADKNCEIAPFQTLMGSAKLPLVIPKNSKI